MDPRATPGLWPFLAPADTAVVPAPVRPSLAVAVTAHDVAAFLPAALESALAQTLPADEVVVVDDGSEDDVEGAVAPYRDRIRLVRQANGGEGAAKNTAARLATADYLVVLDGDDEMHPRRLEAIADVLTRRPDLDIVTTQFREFGPAAEEGERPRAEGWPAEDQRAVLLRRNFLPAPALRRSAVLAAGGFDTTLRYGPDWELYIRMALRGARAGLVVAPLYRYRRWQGQQTADDARVLSGRIDVLRKVAADPLLTDSDGEVVAAALASARLDLLRWQLRHRAPARANGRHVAAAADLPLRSRLLGAAATVSPAAARAVELRRHPVPARP